MYVYIYISPLFRVRNLQFRNSSAIYAAPLYNLTKEMNTRDRSTSTTQYIARWR